MCNIRILPNLLGLFILCLITLDESRLRVEAQKISLPATQDNYKDELFKEMAKVFKILQEHPLAESPSSTQFSHYPPTTETEKRSIESSSRIQNISSATEYDRMFIVPFEKNGKKKARSVDLKYKATDARKISPLLGINSNFMRREFSTHLYTEDFQNKWFNTKYKVRRFNNHNGGHKKIWRQFVGHSYDPENYSDWTPKSIKHEKKRKSRKLDAKSPTLVGNKEIFSAFDNIRENFKRTYTSGNSSQKRNDTANKRRYFGKYPGYKIELQTFKSDERDKFLNYFISSTENSPKFSDTKYVTRKKISKYSRSTTASNFHLRTIIKAQQFAQLKKGYLPKSFDSTSTETIYNSTEHKSKRNDVEDMNLHQIESINHSMEDQSFINQLLNYAQSHFNIVVSIFVLSITTIIILGTIAFFIGRKQARSGKNTTISSPSGIQSFDLPARPDFNFNDIKPKAKTSKSGNEKIKERDDGRSMFSIGSQSSMSEVNSKHLIPIAKLRNTERSNQELSRLVRIAGNSADPRNRNGMSNGFDSKPGERLLRLHRNLSSRSSMLQSSGSQQSTKSSPIQRREELEKFLRTRANTGPKNGSPIIPKAYGTKPVRPKIPTNPFEEKEDNEMATDLQDIVGNVKFSSGIPPPAESKLKCVNRLLANKPSGFNISPTNKSAMNSIRPQNGAFKNSDKALVKVSDVQHNSLAKHCDDLAKETSSALGGFSDDEPGIDF
ncbi:hypothetical protein AVEN_79112-1 [Araneus ventricosus]|uniref:Uncharacterized protein n=1 Tax=Araneus ventricosus TaxID=182803 RepID=A0A4Y2IL85_ARAVE|nr:hypothetical protein AVEN_79112-1 [Araneus ventricosus]